MRHSIIAMAILVSSITGSEAADRFAVIDRGETTIRVDTQTGRVSFCRNEKGKPVCKIAAEEREAWMKEVSGLEQRIDELQKQVEKLPNEPGLRREKEIDKALETAETMMRRFLGMMKELKNDLESK